MQGEKKTRKRKKERKKIESVLPLLFCIAFGAPTYTSFVSSEKANENPKYELGKDTFTVLMMGIFISRLKVRPGNMQKFTMKKILIMHR